MAPRIDDIWDANPDVRELLQGAASLSAARRALFAYLNSQEQLFLNHDFDMHALELTVVLDCVATLKQIISLRNEAVTGFSALRELFEAARGRRLDESFSPGFKEEFRHLFLAVRGESRLYAEMEPEPPHGLAGRAAAVARSERLDRLARRVDERLESYPSGLDSRIVTRRRDNQHRIIDALGGSTADWGDYRWQLAHVVRDARTLARMVRLSPDEYAAIESARANGVPFGVTPHYVSLMDYNLSRVLDHSIRAQVIPPASYVERMQASRDSGGHSLDFMLERDTSPVDLVTRRYPRIAILKPYNTCAQVCVYCQRNWEIAEPMAPQAQATARQLDDALRWFRHHPMVTEVLVTGGDPLVADTRFIVGLLIRLARIEHIERIRIGTRTFVTVPQRITPHLAGAIARLHQPGRREIALVTHVQHVYEVTPETVRAVQEFRRRGVSVYNQVVFTRENSRRYEAAALRRLLRLVGVDPYYTFNTKGKDETEDYRVPIARLLQEQKEEARLMTGLIRTDEAVFNVPGMGKNYVRAGQHHRVIMVLADGRRVYEFHPWEKGISLAKTYLETDVGIWEYLEWLKSVGERPHDYRSIWYYH